MKNGQTHVHLLGICGVGMGALAELLVEAGYRVTGSDANIYPPMSDRLASLGIIPFDVYDAKHLKERPDLVIIGNALTKENPEAAAAINQEIPYRSMPHALRELFLTTRTPLVVAGTHGKTTTATLMAWLLETAGEEPGFFIGGMGKNFEQNARLGKGRFFVVEGDEYDTAFFDKGPKFLHYRPYAAILTSVEFDHADIYRNLDEVRETFRRFVTTLPQDGFLVVNADDPEARKLSGEAAPCRVISYSLCDKGNYNASQLTANEMGTRFTITTPNGSQELFLRLWGEHNISNAIASFALLAELGISHTQLAEGMKTFQGVKRRQEVIGEEKDVVVIDDFAHHPTAVEKTIFAMRARYPNRRLWAIFEPRSNTSRRNAFQLDYVQALRGADRVAIAQVYHEQAIPKKERLDCQAIADELMNHGVDSHYIPRTEHLLEHLLRNCDSGDVMLIMSNGGFDGLHRKILEKLGRRRISTNHEQLKPSRIPKHAR